MTDAIDFYYTPESPPCNAIILTAKYLGVELNLKKLDLEIAEDHLKPEFLKLNPMHTVPTIVDNGVAIFESRAINIYLVEKYGTHDGVDSLYTKDPLRRAVINQRLFFDLGTLSQRFADYVYPQILKMPADPQKFEQLQEALGFLNTFLDAGKWLAGSQLNLADITVAVTIAAYEVAAVDLTPYPNVTRWFADCKAALSGWSIVESNFEELKSYLVLEKM